MDNMLLFSTGLDSFIIKTLLKFPDDQCLFIDMQTPENEIEKEKLQFYFPGTHKALMPLQRFALPNHIIPFRNHMMALIGFQFAKNLYFGFTAGDTTRDKDYVFKAQMEGLTNYFGGIPEKVKVQGPYEIKMPYKSNTKAELVGIYLSAGYAATKLLSHTTSCYEGSSALFGCGRCRSCLRKFVAISLHSEELGQRMINGTEYNPMDSLNTFYQESLGKHRNVREMEDIKKCLEKM